MASRVNDTDRNKGRKERSDSLGGGSELELSTTHGSRADELMHPLLPPQPDADAGDSTGRANGSQHTLMEADGTEEKGTVTENYDSTHPHFEKEKSGTYRDLQCNRYPTQTVMIAVVSCQDVAMKPYGLKVLRKGDQWIWTPLNVYSRCCRPSPISTDTKCHQQCYNGLRMLIYCLGYGFTLAVTGISKIILCLLGSFRAFCGAIVEPTTAYHNRGVFNRSRSNQSWTELIGCPWDEYAVSLRREISNDKDSYSPVKYFASSDVVFIEGTFSKVEEMTRLRLWISEIAATSYGRTLGIIIYGNTDEPDHSMWRCFTKSSFDRFCGCLFIRFEGLMILFCDPSKISSCDAKNVGTYHILTYAFERGKFPRDNSLKGLTPESEERRHCNRFTVVPASSGSPLSVGTMPGRCMQNTFFDFVTFCKPFVLIALVMYSVRHIAKFSLGAQMVLLLPLFMVVALSSQAGISPRLCVCGRRHLPRLIRSFWGPAKAWLFLDVFFVFQTLQLNTYPFGGAVLRGKYVMLRIVALEIILGATSLVYISKAESQHPYLQQLVLIILAFVAVFGFWLALYVDRRYLQAFSGTSKVVLCDVTSGMAQFSNISEGFFAYREAVWEGSNLPSKSLSSSDHETKLKQGSCHHSCNQIWDKGMSRTNSHCVFSEEYRDVIVSQILAESRQKSISIWTRVLSIFGGFLATAIHSLAYFEIGDRAFLSGDVVDRVEGVAVIVTGSILGTCVSILIASVGSTVDAYSLTMRLLHQMIREDSTDKEEVFFPHAFQYVVHTFTKIWPLSMARDTFERNAGYRLVSKTPMYLASNVYSFLEMWREVVVQCQHDFAENSGTIVATLLAIIGFGAYLLYTWIEGVNPLERGPVLLDGLFIVFVLFILLLKASMLENTRDNISERLQRWLEEVRKAKRNAQELDSGAQYNELEAAYAALQEAKESIENCTVVVIAWPGIPLDKRLLYSIFSVLVTGIVKLGMSIAQSLRDENE